MISYISKGMKAKLKKILKSPMIRKEIQRILSLPSYKRELHGEACPWSKLTDKDVQKIRKMYKKGVCGFIKLGKQFNVGKQTISNIIKRDTWRHVK